MRELFCKKGIWAASAAVFLAMLSGIPAGRLQPPLSTGSVFTFYKDALQSQTVIFIIPVASVLPAGAVFFLVCFLLVYPRELVGGFDRAAAGECFLLLLRICLLGGIMGEIAGSLASLFLNYYMAYGLPFVCYYMLIILKDRYLTDMYAMDPEEWIVLGRYWGEGGKGIWVFLSAFTAASALLCGLLTGYRLKEIA